MVTVERWHFSVGNVDISTMIVWTLSYVWNAGTALLEGSVTILQPGLQLMPLQSWTKTGKLLFGMMCLPLQGSLC